MKQPNRFQKRRKFCCGDIHCLSIITRNTSPKKLKLPITGKRSVICKRAAATKQETRVLRSLGLSRCGTVEVFPTASHIPEPEEYNKDLRYGFPDKVQIVLPCETYMASQCFPQSLSRPPCITHTLERKDRKRLPGRGEVG